MVTLRAYNILQNAEIRTLDQIRSFGVAHFQRYPHCGRVTLIAIGALIGEDWSLSKRISFTAEARLSDMIEELEALGYQVTPPSKPNT
jgi:hypothetical protein